MMYPLKFKPLMKTLVWGGEKIAPFKGISTEQKNIGESWEVSAVRGNVSVVDGGAFDGRSLTDLVNEYAGVLVGEKVYAENGNEFPLLIKFIDARDNLSIQVHPDDALAARTCPGKKGKTEMWYVVGAEEGARLLSGLTKEITPESYEGLVRDGGITDVLASHPIAPGDVYFLPAGRIHAIGAGCFVAEIQQTSDITYRIYDYGRPGLDGKPRELHVEQAKEAIDYSVSPEGYRTVYSKKKNAECLLASCKYFTTALLDLDTDFRKDLSGLDSFVAVICVGGEGVLTDTEGDGSVHEVSIRQGETVLIPASSTGIGLRPLSPGQNLTCLTTWVE